MEEFEKTEVIVGIEPTGHYWLNLAYFLDEKGIPLVMTNPMHVKRSKELDDNRKTPAEVNNDGKDFVPTNRVVLFGHHFAAIAGAGPLVGPVLAAQMGYLPGTLWIIVGVVLAGAVQDFIILFALSVATEKSFGEMIKEEMGKWTGIVSMIGILGIMIILLAVLALVVVKALVGSPCGLFTVASTIPIAIIMGIYMRFIHPGRIGEASLIGIILLFLALLFDRYVGEHPQLSEIFSLSGETIAILMIIYGFVASVLPVWLLLAPRDYLSTFLKIGTIAALAVGIFIAMPELHMPAVTKFIDGTGPVFSGNLFLFLFITIACGAVSGFHSLIDHLFLGLYHYPRDDHRRGRQNRRRNDPVPDGRSAFLCDRYGPNLFRCHRRSRLYGLLVPLCHPVRSPVHPVNGRRRNKGGPFHDPRNHRDVLQALCQYGSVDPQCDRNRPLYPSGAISFTRASSIRWGASARCGRCSASRTRCWRESPYCSARPSCLRWARKSTRG